MPRNRILAEVFLRTGMIEKLGTGILRIKELYAVNTVKPAFEALDNSIRVRLPVLSDFSLSKDEEIVYAVLSKANALSTSEVTELVPFGKSKVLTILKNLAARNIVFIEGSGRGTKYHL